MMNKTMEKHWRTGTQKRIHVKIAKKTLIFWCNQ